MKLAISNLAWNIEEDEAIKQVLIEEKISSIEVAPTKLWSNPTTVNEEEISKVIQFWGNDNINIVAMQSLLFGKPELAIFNEEHNRVTMLTYLKHIIETGAKLGAKYFVFGSPKNRQINSITNAKTNIAIDFFTQLGEISKKNNVFFCIEPNPKLYDCDFITNTQEAIDLIKCVNHPGFQLHLDAAALTLNNENLERSIEAAAPYLKHFHISSPYLGEITDKRVNHLAISKALKSIDYTNYVSIEMKTISETNNLDIVRANLQYAKEFYES